VIRSFRFPVTHTPETQEGREHVEQRFIEMMRDMGIAVVALRVLDGVIEFDVEEP
jgi:hypothetical protein